MSICWWVDWLVCHELLKKYVIATFEDLVIVEHICQENIYDLDGEQFMSRYIDVCILIPFKHTIFIFSI